MIERLYFYLFIYSNGGDGDCQSSLSVLSPFDEQEEWLKILEILNSFNSGLSSSENGQVGNSTDSDLLDDVQRELQNRLGKSKAIFSYIPLRKEI